MAILIEDPKGNERLISWLKVMFPEARAKTVLKPKDYLSKSNRKAGSRNTPYGLISHILSGRRPRSSRTDTSH